MADVVREHGPWIASNIDLGHGVQTIGRTGTSEIRVERIVQLVSDYARRPLDELRILDLGCLEGAFAVALSRRGAHVTAVEGRAEHIAKVRYVKTALKLDGLEPVQQDVREFPFDPDAYDVVLCLGLLYHLEAPDVVELARNVARATRHLAIVETQVGLSGPETASVDGLTMRGKAYAEDTVQHAASIENQTSFWPTRASLLNLLQHVGFTSITEVQAPRVSIVSDYRDHVVLLAAKGQRVRPVAEFPERPALMAHPSQGGRWRLINRLGELRGHGLKGVWTKT